MAAAPGLVTPARGAYVEWLVPRTCPEGGTW
jgi:hypothetical protein